MSDQELAHFAEQLHQDLLVEAHRPGEERMIRDVFVDRVVDDLAMAGEVEDGLACFHQARGLEISGYNLSTDGHTLDLFGVVLTQTSPPRVVTRAEVDTCLRRLRRFLDRAATSGHAGLEEASPVFDMFLKISQCLPEVTRIRLFLFTDGLTTVVDLPSDTFQDVPTTTHVWDLRRLHRLVTSGRRQEPVNVDFAQDHGRPIPCLTTNDAGEHRTLLAVVPGTVLQRIYAEFGSRLLELNVRSFLQARGKVNQGIRRTIIDHPHRFLAYNNGISATASHVDLVTGDDGGLAIGAVSNLQIVNGGQTTASLHHAVVKDKADLSDVHVQMKLTVVEPEHLDHVVPLISRFANSQNSVNDADFSANHPYHVELERLSRTVWAPARNGTQRQTRWFYERARGQYQDALFHVGTRARAKQFRDNNPPHQRFTKTDVAKYMLSWDQKPHLVSLGAQKCFREFTLLLEENGTRTAEREHFEELVAKAILFRTTEKLVSSLGLVGYRANVVTYTIALLSYRTEKGTDLGQIWRTQGIDDDTRKAISELAPRVYGRLVHVPQGGNVTEWAKKPACWERVRNIE